MDNPNITANLGVIRGSALVLNGGPDAVDEVGLLRKIEERLKNPDAWDIAEARKLLMEARKYVDRIYQAAKNPEDFSG